MVHVELRVVCDRRLQFLFGRTVTGEVLRLVTRESRDRAYQEQARVFLCASAPNCNRAKLLAIQIRGAQSSLEPCQLIRCQSHHEHFKPHNVQIRYNSSFEEIKP